MCITAHPRCAHLHGYRLLIALLGLVEVISHIRDVVPSGELEPPAYGLEGSPTWGNGI
jgi:hypothetical protein